MLSGSVRAPERPQPGAPGRSRSERWALRRSGSTTASPQTGTTAPTITLVALTLMSAVGLHRVFTGRGWLVPVVLTAVGVHAVCWATRRSRLPKVLALLLGLAAVWALTAWTVLGAFTAYGFPGRDTASHFWGALVQAHTDFATAVSPVPASNTGFKLIAVLAVGLVAVLGDWAAFRWRSALYGTAPAFAYFVTCCAFGQGSGRELAVAVEVVAMLVFLLVHRTTVGRADQAWFGNHRAGTAGWAMSAGFLTAVVALLAAVVVTPAVSHTEGAGIFGWHNGIGNSSGPREVANPVVDLHTRLLQESDTPVFTVQSADPSYWRITSLDTFNGQQWVSTDSYRNFADRLPGVQAVPPATRLVEDTFAIQQLESVWLPDAFTPISVTGVRGVSYDAASNSLITSKATADGLTYTVESYQYLSSLDPSELKSAPPVPITTSLRRFVQLPSPMPSPIVDLAKTITAGQTTEYGKALALQNFFLTPKFSYTLNPPDDGYGINSLIDFLFTTRKGYCQQFAGAYAVMARAIGLPTRLAVGFSTGLDGGGGFYQVTDADAHTWPEVYFGPQYGWLPFEPTPSFSDPMSAGYAPAPATSRGGAGNGSTSPTTAPSTPPAKATQPGFKGRLIAPPATSGRLQVRPASTGGHIGAFWLALIVIVGSAIAWSGFVAGGRRARWSLRRRRDRSDPRAGVLGAWNEAVEVLSWWGSSRQPGETDDEFATRAARLVNARLRGPSPWLSAEILRLAGLATEAAFAPRIEPQRAGEAASAAHEIHRYLFHAAPARQRLRWVLIPRPGLRAGSGADQTRTSGPGGQSTAHEPWGRRTRAVPGSA